MTLDTFITINWRCS